MSNVILDFLGLVHGLPELADQFGAHDHYFQNTDSTEDLLCRQNLLTALVLFDNIYINDDYRAPSISTTTLNRFFALLHSIPGYTSFIHSIPIRRLPYHSYTRSLVDQLIDIMDQQYPFASYEERYLLERSLIYSYQANLMGISYLPHPRRALLLDNLNAYQHSIDALVYLKLVDRVVEEYYKAINELAQQQLLTTSFPALYRFISDMAKDPIDEIKVALRLRSNEKVIAFRESVNQIDENMKKGNYKALRDSLQVVLDRCNDITHSLNLGDSPIEITIAPTLSVKLNINLKLRFLSGFHTTFLCDLTKHAIKGTFPYDYLSL